MWFSWATVLLFTMIGIVLIPLCVTRLYEGLRVRKVSSIVIAISCILALLIPLVDLEELDKKELGAVLMLLSPFIFVVLFKFGDYLVLNLFKRNLVIPNRWTILPGEKFNLLDIIIFIALILLPIGIPFLIRDYIVKCLCL